MTSPPVTVSSTWTGPHCVCAVVAGDRRRTAAGGLAGGRSRARGLPVAVVDEVIGGRRSRSRACCSVRGVVAEHQHHHRDGGQEPGRDPPHVADQLKVSRWSWSGGRPAASRAAVSDVGPGGRTADVDVALGQVGQPAAQDGHVVGAADVGARRRARSRRPPAAGQLDDLQAALGRQDGQLVAEERCVGVALEQHGLAPGVRRPLGEGAQRRDADAGAEVGDPALGARAVGEPAVGSLDQRARPGPRVATAALPSPALGDGDPQAAAVGGGGERVRVRAAPARAGRGSASRGTGRPPRRSRCRRAREVDRPHAGRLGHDAW